ncbi:MAG TPA: hypothetical protein VE621_15485, partial [Bryobacteraceae bacterium]|nr:hypothetical protein [Bryobacteraceae bacterium]
RLDDLPLSGDVPKRPGPHKEGELGGDAGYTKLQELGYAGSMNVGFWWGDPFGHGYNAEGLPKTTAERSQWGKQGEAELEQLVADMQLPVVISALRDHGKYTQEEVVGKYRKMIP